MTAPLKGAWTKTSAAEICALAPLGQPAQTLAVAGLEPGHYLERLLAHGMHADALRLLAFGLPLRRAIWWGCLCVRHAARGVLSADREPILRATASWAAEPGEARRQAVEQLMLSEALSHAAGCLAWAVAATGPRIPYPGLPPLPPQPQLAPRAVNGAVMSAAASAPAERAATIHAELVAIGIHVLEGRYLWDATH